MTEKKPRRPEWSDNPRPSAKRKLIEFADLYRGGPGDVIGNATACYMAVHPRASRTSASSKANTYLKHPVVQERLNEKTEEISQKADVTQERVLKEIARIGLFDPRKMFDNTGRPLPISELDDDVAAAIAGIKVRQISGGDDEVGEVIEYKIADKNSALEKLMKYLGAYEKDNAQKAKSLQELIDEVRGEG